MKIFFGIFFFNILFKKIFLKFITFSTSYVVLVFLVIYSSLDNPSDEINRERFSLFYPGFYKNFTAYTSNSKLTYYFPVNDFYIRRNMPSISDIVLCIWLAGTKEFFSIFIRFLPFKIIINSISISTSKV